MNIGIFLALMLASAMPAFGQEIPYIYEIVPQTGLQDLNTRGDLIATVINSGSLGVLTLQNNGRSAAPQPLEFRVTGQLFDDTAARRINNPGDVAGSFLTAPSAPSRELGFIRTKAGAFTFVDVPGSDGTAVHAISDRRDVCGQYYNPLIPTASGFARFHGFCRTSRGTFQTVDIPLDHSVTIITGVNRSGKKVGNYFTYNPATNETGQWHAFMLDNGVVTSLERPGRTWSYVSDLNNHDVVLYEDDEDIFVVDDGRYYKISDPTPDAGWTLGQVDVNGINDDLEIVGSFIQRQQCPQSFCPFKQTSFVARPR